MNRPAFPVASVLALLLIGLAFWYLIRSETPRGQVQGVAVLADADNRPLSDCDVYLTPATPDDDADGEPRAALASANDPRERRHAVTDKSGHFTLRGVPAGAYMLSASARWHSLKKSVTVTVDEGRVVSNTLRLSRSEPDLGIGDHQATFATTEKPFLPVRGYVALVPEKGVPPSKTLRVKVWRTRLSEVLKRSDAAADLQKLRYSYDGNQATLSNTLLHPADGAADTPELVADTTVPIKGVDREGFFVDRTPLDAARTKPGLYLVKFAYGKHAACSYVLVTDLALVVKQAPSQIIGYAAHLQRGTPVAGARLRVLRQGRTLASGRTDASGVATLDSERINPGGGDAENDTPLLTMASDGQDEAVVSRSYWSGDENAGRYVVQTLTDRTVYRPGDTVQYKGIVRQHRDDPDRAPGYRVPRGLPVTVEIRDASGGLLRREEKTTNNAGSFWGSVETSPEGETGAYTIVAKVGGEEHTTEVLIAAYRKPEYAVTVSPGKAHYRRGEPVELAINATYYFGAPVAGAKVHYYVYRDADWSAEYGPQDDLYSENEDGESSYRDSAYQAYYGETVAEGEATLDENGKALVTVPTDVRHPQASGEDEDRDKAADDEPLPQAETYTMTAEVTDESKRSVEAEGAAKVTAGDLVLNVAPEGYVATPGKPTQVFVTARDLDGKPLPNVAVTLAAAYDEWDKKKKESVRKPFGTPQSATTGADGRALLSLTPAHTGELRLVATARDSGGRAIRSEGSLWAAGDNSDELDTDYGDLTLLTDKRQYSPGDTARVLVNTARTGQTILLSVEGERVYQTFTIPARKHSTVVTVPVKAAWGPNVVLVANYVRDKKFASSETPLRVALAARNLAISVKPWAATGTSRATP